MPRDTAHATTPDLVLLGLLAERPQHGYDLVAELERRDVEDWAAVSRPQVYYSLKKLSKNGWIEPAEDDGPSLGPERRAFRITALGTECLKANLAKKDWARGRTLPAFVTWIALAIHADPDARKSVIEERGRYLREQVERERGHLSEVVADHGPSAAAGVLMVRFTIEGFEHELSWLAEVEATLLDANSHVKGP